MFTYYFVDNQASKAEEMLKFSDESVLSVALTCGFYDSAHFIREFKAEYGVSPTAYRLK
ncbi:MAG: helix-turn-helix transcriptional regulator [Clostridia bacterium]|nr:helix-turn-helix transcriptional regulator [Clostridia bacterium]